MSRPHARRYVVLLTLLMALFAAAALPAAAAPERDPLSASGDLTEPSASPVLSLGSCKDIRALFSFAPDGVYPVLAGGNTLITVFCYDMSGTPRDYIELARTGEDVNFSQYTAGGASPGTNVRTSFTKLRIDPATLTVDVGDLTFATSTGKLQHSSVTRGPSSAYVTSMPYGVGMTCANPGTAPNGVGNVDLHGTPFTVNDTFQVRSFAGTGSATVSDDKQKVDLLVSGYCGWIAAEPAIDPGYNPQPGNYRLNLACAAPDTATARPGQYCLTLF